MALGMQTVLHIEKLHVVCGRFTKFAVYRHSRVTISQHCQYYQANASKCLIDLHQNTQETKDNEH